MTKFLATGQDVEVRRLYLTTSKMPLYMTKNFPHTSHVVFTTIVRRLYMNCLKSPLSDLCLVCICIMYVCIYV